MTTEPKHTPEPWPQDGDADNAPDMSFAGNYERARDCVNACAGLPDIELRGATEQGGVKAVMNRLCADNERLREALRACESQMSSIECGYEKGIGFGQVLDAARAALASLDK